MIVKKKIRKSSSIFTTGRSDNNNKLLCILYYNIIYYYVCVSLISCCSTCLGRGYRYYYYLAAADDYTASSGHGAFLFFSRTGGRRDRQQTTNIIYMHTHSAFVHNIYAYIRYTSVYVRRRVLLLYRRKHNQGETITTLFFFSFDYIVVGIKKKKHMPNTNISTRVCIRDRHLYNIRVFSCSCLVIKHDGICWCTHRLQIQTKTNETRRRVKHIEQNNGKKIRIYYLKPNIPRVSYIFL